jgi:hypothetical protein
LGTIGGAILYQNSGKISQIDNTGAATGGAITPQDIAATLGWGGELIRDLDVGIAVKYISTKIEASAATGAVDLGTRWRARFFGTEAAYALAATIRNLGGQLKFHNVADPLPTTVVIGQTLRPFKPLTLSLNIIAPHNATPYASIGAEFRASMGEALSAALRAGHNGRTSSSDVGGSTGFTFGAGINFRRLSFDYAWTPVGALGDTQRVTVSYRF